MIHFFKAQIKDAPEIKKLLHETWTETYSDTYTQDQIDKITSEWHSLDFLAQQIKDRNINFIVAKEGKRIVGLCNAQLINEDDRINIQRLHVAPKYQHQWVGSALLKEIVRAFPGAVKLELEVEKRNQKALNFYLKQGFKKIGEKVFEVQNVQVPTIVMERVL